MGVGPKGKFQLVPASRNPPRATMTDATGTETGHRLHSGFTVKCTHTSGPEALNPV